MSIPAIRLHGVVISLEKHRDNFTFTFTFTFSFTFTFTFSDNYK
jgi:hypothetical protein